MGKTSGSNRKLDGPGIGSVPRGKGGSMRKPDGPGVGKAAGGGNNKNLPATSHAGGKPHPAFGEGRKQTYNNPKVKCYAQGPQGKQSGGY